MEFGITSMTCLQTAITYRIISYVYGTPINMEAEKLTHANYAFGSIIDNKVYVSNKEDLARLVSFKAINPNLKVILSIGGWGAEGFSDAAYSRYSREVFASSCLDFINDYNLDGIDIDWEYPVSGACYLIKCRPEDKMNFTLLLQSIRDKIGWDKILSIAAGADRFYIDNTEINKIVSICDYINLMTYDFSNDTYNANLYPTTSNYGSPNSCDESVNMYIRTGVKPSKINLGIPFYGRLGKEYLSYETLVKEYINKNNWISHWDDEAKAAYLKNNELFITYEDEKSISYKTNYIKARGFGGAMFWEYNQDYKGILLNKVWRGLN